jgi:hypothetical protein
LGGRTVRRISRRNALGIMTSAAGVTVLHGIIARRAVAAPAISARVVAMDIPGASAIAQVGTFLNDPQACAHPIPTNFPSYIQSGAVLDPKRILVGSRSNFGAPLAIGVGQEGAYLSIDPSSSHTLHVPSKFARGGDQASTLGGLVQMFSANSPFLAQQRTQPGRGHSSVRWREQPARSVQQQCLRSCLAGDRAVRRDRYRLVFDP